MFTLACYEKGIYDSTFTNNYSKTPLLRPPLGLWKNGLYNWVVLLLS